MAILRIQTTTAREGKTEDFNKSALMFQRNKSVVREFTISLS